jgi:carboxyl-terminal processing protease
MKRPFATFRAAAAATALLFASSFSHAAAPIPTDVALASLQASYARAVAPGEQADLYRDLFATILQRVQRSYATEIDLSLFSDAALAALAPLAPGAGEPGEVFKKAVNAGLGSLDPYSRYLDPRAAGDRSNITGSFGGLGVEIEPSDGVLRVVATIPESPAARAGLQAGDFIVRVDDQPLSGVPMPDAITRMRGQPGTAVSLTVRRPGLEQEFTLAITRDTIRRKLVHWQMEGDVLVLRMTSFTGPVSVLLAQAINEATAQGTPKAVVLDLRGNPGGLLVEAVRTADAFLAKGEIVSLRGRTPASQRTWQADAEELLPGVPMLVLVDRRSASASELVADALQENGRAKVMGQRSFGKGSVQTTYSLGENRGALKLTTSLYHGPSGRTVQRVGVAPDIELGAANGPAATGTPVSRLQVAPARCPALKAPDPMLSCALAYLQAGSLEAFLSLLGEASP